MNPETPAFNEDRKAPTSRGARWWSTLLRQLTAFVVLPTIAIVLPWQLAWRVLRAYAERGNFLHEETERARAPCDAQGLVQDVHAWTKRHRLTRLVDHVDPVVSMTRGDRFIDRHVVVAGDPIPAGPCIFIGFHYGVGLWALRHLRRLGHRVSFIAAAVTAQHFPGQRIAFAYMRLRKLGVERAGGAPVIVVGGSGEKIRGALRAGTSVLALIDVPDATTPTLAVPLLGHDVQLPDGILRIAVSEGVPLVGYVAALDPQTGTRRLRFTRLADHPTQALRALAAMLDAAIREDPASWHFWAEWPRFSATAPASPAAGTGAAVR